MPGSKSEYKISIDSIHTLKLISTDLEDLNDLHPDLKTQRLVVRNNELLENCNIPLLCKNHLNGSILTVENNAGCTSMEELLESCMVSTAEESELTYHLFPNPATHIFQIEGLPSNATLTLYNSFGQTFDVDRNLDQIDVSHLLDGIYYLSVVDGELRRTLRFLKM